MNYFQIGILQSLTSVGQIKVYFKVMIQKRTIGIVGTGNVGVAVAYAIFLQALSSEIINHKGNTSTAIGSVIARVAEVILDDGRTVMSVSVRLTGQFGLQDVCLSIPALLGRNGVEATFQPPLSATEREGLQRSAIVLKDQLAGIHI